MKNRRKKRMLLIGGPLRWFTGGLLWRVSVGLFLLWRVSVPGEAVAPKKV